MSRTEVASFGVDTHDEVSMMGGMARKVSSIVEELGYRGEWLGAGNAYVFRGEDIRGVQEHFGEEIAKGEFESPEDFPTVVREIVMSNMDCDDLPTSMDEQVVVSVECGEGIEILHFTTSMEKFVQFRPRGV